MRVGNKEYIVDWQHLAFLALIAGGIAWYLLDARSVSLATNNLLLVQPLSLFGLLLCAFILPQCVRRADQPVEAQDEDVDPVGMSQPEEARELLHIAALALALGVMIFTIPYLGFDVCLLAFAAVAMAVCGERRPWALLLYPLLVTLCAVYGFRLLMPYPMETLFL